MGAGSGAGAEITSEAECAQAFFCGILDYFSGKSGKKNADIVDANGMFKRFKTLPKNKTTGVIDERNKSFNYESFKNLINTYEGEGWENKVMKNHVKIEKKISEIEKFLKKNPKWFFSSINIAESLQKEIKSRLGNNWNFTTKDYFFHRIGGENSLMGDISDIFNYVNKKNENYFSNINRWCPADIYISSKTNDKDAVKNLKEFICNSGKTKKTIEGKSFSSDNINFDELNYILRSFVKNGKLLPVSLKQNGNKIQIVPIKMFNSGPPMKAVNKRGEFTKNKFIDDIATISFPPAGEMYEISFFSSMDIHILASEASAKKFGYQTMKMQIRDKSSSSSNRIEFKKPNSEWKFGIQGMVKFTPAKAQAGGVGGGVLDKLLGINSNDLGMGGPQSGGATKDAVSSIASKFVWNKSQKKFTFATKLTKAEVDFIMKFSDLSQKMVKGSGEAIAKINYCLEQLHAENKGTPKHPGVKGKLKRDKIQQTDRYKVARWFLAKYYCMNVMNELKNSPTAKKGLKQIFAAALSLDKTGKSGKLGGGSMFFVKAG